LNLNFTIIKNRELPNEKSAIALMIEKTSVIKRPLVEINNKVILLGFDEAEYKKVLK